MPDVQFCSNALPSAGGFPAYRKAPSPNPAGLCGREGDGGGLRFAEEPSLSGQFAQFWELRVMAQQAPPEEVVPSRLRRQLPHNRSPNCTEA